jgi:hypothetical protein
MFELLIGLAAYIGDFLIQLEKEGKSQPIGERV